MGLSNKLSCEAGSFSHCYHNPHRCFQSVVWGFISPHWSPDWVTRSVAESISCCLVSQLQPCLLRPTIRGLAGATSHCHAHPGPPATALLRVLSARLPVSTTPTGLDECVFFNSLVVGFPYSLIFCQFWLFFVFKLLLSFFWLWEEAQCVYLHLHLGC